MHGASVVSGGLRYVLGIAGTREPVGRKARGKPSRLTRRRLHKIRTCQRLLPNVRDAYPNIMGFIDENKDLSREYTRIKANEKLATENTEHTENASVNSVSSVAEPQAAKELR